jgi:cell division protein FtsN
MAHKDYVSRGQKKRPVKKKAVAQPLPWFRILLALAIIGAFAYGLWFLSTSNTSKPEPLADKPESVKAISPKTNELEDQSSLPVLEEEQWEFIESLPNYSVEVDVEEQQVSQRPYLMQCGSFRTEGQAEKLKAEIAFQGMEAQVLESKGKNGIWYRVVLGPFDRKREAEKGRHQLRRANINNCKIWFWN